MPDPLPDSAGKVAVTDPKADILVNPSELRAIITSTLTLLGIATSIVTALAHYVSAHDLAGGINFLKQQDTLAGLVSIAGAALYVWRMLAVKWRKRQETKLAIRAQGAALTKPVAVHIVEEALSPLRAPEPETRAPETIKGANQALNLGDPI